MNKLVEEIIKPILEANPQIKKIVGVYGGRFQPFGPHHYKTYKWLTKQVDEAYISTSNIKKPPRHPMNFKEKVRHMSKMGVPSSKIIEEKTPYVAKNLQKKFNKDTTAFVYVFGAKDAGRLGGSGKYYKDYKKNKKNLVGYEEHGYYLVAPHVSISVGGKEVSGTTMRELLGSDKYDDKQRAKLFKKMFGYFNKGVFQMMVNKFKKLFEINEGLPTKVKDKHKKLKVNPKTDAEKDFYIHHSGDSIGAASERDTYDWDDDFREKGGVQDDEKDDKVYGYEPVEEWDNTKERPLKKKWKDGKDKELIKGWLEEDWFKKGSKKDRALKLKISKLYSKAFKMMPGSPNQKKIQKEIEKLRNQLSEDINIPVKVGDTILVGRFKNKKMKIKDIGKDKHGMPTINGRKATTFRIHKTVNIFDDIEEDVNVVKKDGEDGGDNFRTYTSPKDSDIDEPYKRDDSATTGKIEKLKRNEEIENFLMCNDINKIIKEISSTSMKGADNAGDDFTYGKQMVDDGPNAFNGGMSGYSGRNKISAEKLGWDVIDYILNVDVDNVPPMEDEVLDMGWPMGPHKSVTYLPAGIGTGITPNNQENLSGRKGYNKWLRNIKAVATEVGMQLMKFRKQDKDVVKQMSKDATDTLKKQKEEEKEKEVEVKDVKVEENVFTKDWWKKELLNEGGAYGHMAHPFDDKDLTFGDLKKIITDGLGGHLNREDGVTEKLDGQNIMVSWKDGKLIAARNKGHIKNGGKTALTKSGIKSKFQGRGNIANAFNFAMNDLEKSIGALSEKQRTKIFNNGYNFMNLEVMWPASANVIDYDVAHLVFHGALIYDDSGNVKGEVKGSARMLAGMIKQVNMHIGKKYAISKPVFLKIPKHQDFGKMKGKFLGKLSRLQKQFNLKESDTLALYHQKWWEQFILKQLKKISPKVLEGLVKRWAFFDKSYKIPKIKQDLKDEPIFLEWVLKTDKENHAKIVKENMRPFEVLFFEVGAEILKNVQGFMAANPNKAVQNMKKNLSKAISDVRKGGDLKKLNRLKVQLDRLKAIGGTKAIVPSEGIVFKYKGKTYKFTGAFAPVNQITGLISF